SLKQLAAGDRRVAFRDPIPASDIVTRLREYDVLAVPSQWLETGPMVVLEAFAAGVPVIGSNLGGIAEMVTNGVDGLLIPAHWLDAWTGAMESLSTDPPLLRTLQQGIRPPRRVADVAMDMAEVYSAVQTVFA